MATPAKKDASSFKFEANITVFGTEVDLKPLEGDEIGYRAPKGEDGIAVSQTALIESGIIEQGGAASKIIPSTTYVKAIVFNKSTKKVEFAAKAMFYSAISDAEKQQIKTWATESDSGKQDAAKKSLMDFTNVRGIVLSGITESSSFTDVAKACWDTTADSGNGDLTAPLKNYKGFILNQYPKIFTVNSVSVYVGPSAPAS